MLYTGIEIHKYIHMIMYLVTKLCFLRLEGNQGVALKYSTKFSQINVEWNGGIIYAC